MSIPITIRNIHKYGWRPDFPDQRDFKFRPKIVNVPLHSVNLKEKYLTPNVYDQGSLGSCTANSLASLVEFYLMNKIPKGTIYTPSRLFIYYYERLIENSVSFDAGAQIRDGIKVLAKMGAPDENLWPYNISKFTKEPSQESIVAAEKLQALGYERIDNTDKAALVGALDQGHPISFGFTVYQSFESLEVAKTGIVPMPSPTESVLGGHAVAIWGYDVNDDHFLVRNSWGSNWGLGGYFKIPGNFVTNPDLASDFWIITNMETI
jgi:C1A family cysteine protease